LYQKLEHSELVDRKVNGTARKACFHSCKVDTSCAKVDLVGSVRTFVLSAADCSSHSGQQLFGTEGFCNIVVGPQF
jgi:hypothetical protein